MIRRGMCKDCRNFVDHPGVQRHLDVKDKCYRERIRRMWTPDNSCPEFEMATGHCVRNGCRTCVRLDWCNIALYFGPRNGCWKRRPL